MKHVTARATNDLLHHYFTNDKFAITPEQIQNLFRKKPDFTIERINNDDFVPHAFVEIKSLVNSNFNDIMDRLHDTIVASVDSQGGSFSVFIIAMKATKIAFFQFYSFAGLLDQYGIDNYKGFVPLNQLIDMDKYIDMNEYTILEND